MEEKKEEEFRRTHFPTFEQPLQRFATLCNDMISE